MCKVGPFRLTFGPVAGTETGDDDDERSRSGRRPVRSPLTHFFPHPPPSPPLTILSPAVPAP